MVKLIFGIIALIGIGMTLALWKASEKENKIIRHPERITLDGAR